MDKFKSIFIAHQDKFKYVLFAGAGIAAINCLTRPDFNLIVYLYTFYIWFMFENKVRFIKTACSS
jgi:hypothetical protein